MISGGLENWVNTRLELNLFLVNTWLITGFPSTDLFSLVTYSNTYSSFGSILHIIVY